MTGRPDIEIQDYIVKPDGKVMRWMGVNEFIERAEEHARANSSMENRYEAFRRMMEESGT